MNDRDKADVLRLIADVTEQADVIAGRRYAACCRAAADKLDPPPTPRVTYTLTLPPGVRYDPADPSWIEVDGCRCDITTHFRDTTSAIVGYAAKELWVRKVRAEPTPSDPPCNERCIDRAVLIDENFALKQQLAEALTERAAMREALWLTTTGTKVALGLCGADQRAELGAWWSRGIDILARIDTEGGAA
jgi:hypothetical protein